MLDKERKGNNKEEEERLAKGEERKKKSPYVFDDFDQLDHGEGFLYCGDGRKVLHHDFHFCSNLPKRKMHSFVKREQRQQISFSVFRRRFESRWLLVHIVPKTENGKGLETYSGKDKKHERKTTRKKKKKRKRKK
jgi:hypothetical protein